MGFVTSCRWLSIDLEDCSSNLQLVLPRSFRQEMMQQMHNCKAAGHLGGDKTLNKIKTRYYWSGMSGDVEKWCKSCLTCQKRKSGSGLGKSALNHNTIYHPMKCKAIDIWAFCQSWITITNTLWSSAITFRNGRKRIHYLTTPPKQSRIS